MPKYAPPQAFTANAGWLELRSIRSEAYTQVQSWTITGVEHIASATRTHNQALSAEAAIARPFPLSLQIAKVVNVEPCVAQY